MAARAESLGGQDARLDLAASARSLPFAWLEREAFPIAIAALYGIVLLLAMPGELVQDSWSTLVGGREIAQSGLPHREALTVMAHGVRWIDQQWLAQFLFYELFRAGGYRLFLLTHVALVASAFGLALLAARHRGASALSVFLVACACFFVAPWVWQLRAQSFAPLLFVAIFWLLIADGRSPSRKVYLALPLLALWANLHGSVVIGVLLTAIYGLVLLLDRRQRNVLKGLALVALAPVCVLCSPYGLSLIHYYRHLLVDPPFAKLVVEWMAPTPAPITALFYLLAFATVWFVARWGRKLTLFEHLALLVTLASALDAARNIAWFGFVVLMLLPVLLDETRVGRVTGAHPAARTALSVASLAGLAAMLVFVATKPASWYDSLWPDRAALATISANTSNPSTRVFASDRLADWLLWRDPRLRGRVAFDVRFELNTAPQVRRLHEYFTRTGTNWRAADRGYRVIVLARPQHERVRLALLADRRLKETYVDSDVAVFVRAGAPR
jgi:hypothetical protein